MHPVARLPGCPVARLPGCPVARLPGCPVARLPGCPVARLPGCPADLRSEEKWAGPQASRLDCVDGDHGVADEPVLVVEIERYRDVLSAVPEKIVGELGCRDRVMGLPRVASNERTNHRRAGRPGTAYRRRRRSRRPTVGGLNE